MHVAGEPRQVVAIELRILIRGLYFCRDNAPANVLPVALLREGARHPVTWCLSNRAKRCVLTGNISASTNARTTVLQKFFDATLCRPLADWRRKYPNILLFTRS